MQEVFTVLQTTSSRMWTWAERSIISTTFKDIVWTPEDNQGNFIIIPENADDGLLCGILPNSLFSIEHHVGRAGLPFDPSCVRIP